MLIEFTSPTTYSIQERKKETSHSSAISRLLAAAVVNKNFRNLLLTNPSLALDQGYQGESFPLNYNERILVLSIQADNLRDFARQVTSYQEDLIQSLNAEWIPADQNVLILEHK
jgi:hypothetical protein